MKMHWHPGHDVNAHVLPAREIKRTHARVDL